MAKLIRSSRLRLCRYAIIVGIFSLTLTPLNACVGFEPQDEAAELQRLVNQVERELDQLRQYMGKPENETPDIPVFNAEPWEVYFQTLALSRNAERFAFEQTRQHSVSIEVRRSNIKPNHIHELLGKIRAELARVREHYGINSLEPFKSELKEATYNDVFKSIVRANRQLNLMLDRRVSPSDVFEQVTIAIGYASTLLEPFPNTVLIPDEPDFIPNMQPADVYRRLLRCLEMVREVADRQGFKILSIDGNSIDYTGVEPNDVYHLASLVVAELAYLHAKNPKLTAPRDVAYVGRKFPSHVYQRAGILESQLHQLRTCTNSKRLEKRVSTQGN